MKKFVFYSAISIIIMASTHCYLRKPTLFDPFERQEIDSVIMEQSNSESHKKLSHAQIDQLILQVNAAEYAGPYKALYEFRFRVYTKQDTSYRQITSFGSMFKLKKERGDYAFRIQDTSLFRALWMSK
jgi:hypothetical protein